MSGMSRTITYLHQREQAGAAAVRAGRGASSGGGAAPCCQRLLRGFGRKHRGRRPGAVRIGRDARQSSTPHTQLAALHAWGAHSSPLQQHAPGGGWSRGGNGRRGIRSLEVMFGCEACRRCSAAAGRCIGASSGGGGSGDGNGGDASSASLVRRPGCQPRLRSRAAMGCNTGRGRSLRQLASTQARCARDLGLTGHGCGGLLLAAGRRGGARKDAIAAAAAALAGPSPASWLALPAELAGIERIT